MPLVNWEVSELRPPSAPFAEPPNKFCVNDWLKIPEAELGGPPVPVLGAPFLAGLFLSTPPGVPGAPGVLAPYLCSMYFLTTLGVVEPAPPPAPAAPTFEPLLDIEEPTPLLAVDEADWFSKLLPLPACWLAELLAAA